MRNWNVLIKDKAFMDGWFQFVSFGPGWIMFFRHSERMTKDALVFFADRIRAHYLWTNEWGHASGERYHRN